MMWENRHIIRQEVERSRAAHILAHLHMVGWGKRALDRNMPCLTSLRTDTETVVAGQEIGWRAHEHWQTVSGLPAEFREADAALERQLAEEQWDRVEDHRWITVEEVQMAKWACKPGKAPGPDGLVAEVWQHAPPRGGPRPPAGACVRDGASQDLDIGREVMLRVLAKLRVPRAFKVLRPIAVQNVSARVWYRRIFSRLVRSDDRSDNCSLGFKKGHYLVEVSLVFRLLRDRCLEWVWAAAPFNSISRQHTTRSFTPPSAMLARGVPLSEALWYIRDSRSSCLHPCHAHCTAPDKEVSSRGAVAAPWSSVGLYSASSCRSYRIRDGAAGESD